MTDMNYAPLLDIVPPEGTLEAAMRKGAFRQQRLVYRAEYYWEPLTDEKIKGVSVTCTGCGETWIAPYVQGGACGRGGGASFGFYLDKDGPVASGSSVLCPWCGAEARCTHIGEFRNTITDEVWVMTAGRLEDKLVLYGWLLQRITDKDGKASFRTWPYEAYVVERRKIVRLMGYQKCMSSVSLFGHWEQRVRYIDNWGDGEILEFDPAILEGSTAENSAFAQYLKEAGKDAVPVSYLRLWQKHPALENLVVQGAGEMIAAGITEECRRYCYDRAPATPKLEWVNWKEKRPAAMLGLSKPEFRMALREKLTRNDVEAFRALRGAERVSPEEAVRLIRYHGANAVFNAVHGQVFNREEFGVLRILRYVEKQNLWMLEDYWKTARLAGEDISGSLLPKDLRRAHDRVVRVYNEQVDAKLREKMEKEMKERREPFAAAVERFAPLTWEKDGIFIRPVRDEEELALEGKQQDHCCGTYGEKIARGESMIFLMRREKTPEDSWYTLELSKDGKVLQNRGYHNRGKTEEAQQFEDEWMEVVRERMAAKIKKKEKKTA